MLEASRIALTAGAMLALVAASCTDRGRAGDTSAPDSGPPDVGAPDPAAPDAGAPVPATPDPGSVVQPPVRVGYWTYHGVSQGISPKVHDVSADEGGNVYVAAGDAVFAKARSDEQFLRFDAGNAGLSTKCNDPADIFVQFPPNPFVLCPVISVAGAAPGKALIGFDGFGYEADDGVDWALDTGGVDVVAFDPVAKTMNRTRHVRTGAPPHVVCDYGHEQWVDTCEPPEGAEPLESTLWWDWGRRLFRRVNRIAVNHDASTLMYGDAWMGGGHATLAVLLNNTELRNWEDTTAGLDPMWADMKDFWEHHHPIVEGKLPDGTVHSHFGEGYAMSIDPRNGMPWASNGLRTATILGYGVDLTNRRFGMWARDLWPDGDDPYPVDDEADDSVRSLSHCADGTLWAGSLRHGLARIDRSGAISHQPLPNHEGALSVACDWSDGSLWIGVASGGVLRRRGGTFESIAVEGAPAFASQPVKNIQIDRWSDGGRVVYFAFGAVKDANGLITAPGGVAAYDGP